MPSEIGFKISRGQILSPVLNDCCCYSDQMQQCLHDSMQNPFLSLNIKASIETIWFEMLRTDHQTHLNDRQPVCFFCLEWSSLHGTLLCYCMPPKHTCLSFFSHYFPTNISKYVKYRIIMFFVWCQIQPWTHALLKSVVNQNGIILTYSWIDVTKSKHLLQITPQN